MSSVKGGRAQYGEAIGIMMLDTKFPRVPGDIGNATSFSFPVRFLTVQGATPDRIVNRKTDVALLDPFVRAAKQLESDGVRAITTSCGFLAIFQQELASAVRIPVFTSTLMLVPLVHRMLSGDRRVGIITANSKTLSQDHLRGAGAHTTPVAIAGMEDSQEFNHIPKNDQALDPDKVRDEVVSVAKTLVSTNRDVGAVVLECTNLAPYSREIGMAIRLPVFDIIHLVNLVHDTVVIQEERFSGGSM